MLQESLKTVCTQSWVITCLDVDGSFHYYEERNASLEDWRALTGKFISPCCPTWWPIGFWKKTCHVTPGRPTSASLMLVSIKMNYYIDELLTTENIMCCSLWSNSSAVRHGRLWEPRPACEVSRSRVQRSVQTRHSVLHAHRASSQFTTYHCCPRAGVQSCTHRPLQGRAPQATGRTLRHLLGSGPWPGLCVTLHPHTERIRRLREPQKRRTFKGRR